MTERLTDDDFVDRVRDMIGTPDADRDVILHWRNILDHRAVYVAAAAQFKRLERR